MFKSSNGRLLGLFFIRLMKKSGFFVKKTFSQKKLSSGRTHFTIWGIKHHLTLSVKSTQDHGWINFQT